MPFSPSQLTLATCLGLAITSTASFAESDHSQHAQHDAGAAEHLHHQHGKDAWMLEYRFMRMNMEGNLDGKNTIDNQAIYDAGYSMAPTVMSMEMHIFMAMYGITDTLTVMGMFNHISNQMEMAADESAAHSHGGKMFSSGTGDTSLYGMYQPVPALMISLGASLPTGSIDEKTSDNANNLPFAMQLGSGTLDLKPSLTLNLASENWNYGAQGTYTYRTGPNQNDYQLGDRLDASAWIKYVTGNSLFFSTRLAISYWESVSGSDKTMINPGISPAADPTNQGGTRLDALFGVSGMASNGIMLGLEMGLPVFQSLNGPQMKTGMIANASIQLIL